MWNRKQQKTLLSLEWIIEKITLLNIVTIFSDAFCKHPINFISIVNAYLHCTTNKNLLEFNWITFEYKQAFYNESPYNIYCKSNKISIKKEIYLHFFFVYIYIVLFCNLKSNLLKQLNFSAWCCYIQLYNHVSASPHLFSHITQFLIIFAENGWFLPADFGKRCKRLP